MIKRLILARPYIRRDRGPPFFGIAEGGIDIENHATKRKQAMAHHLADLEFGFAFDHRHSPIASFGPLDWSNSTLEQHLLNWNRYQRSNWRIKLLDHLKI
jgi:hypothetical protein